MWPPAWTGIESVSEAKEDFLTADLVSDGTQWITTQVGNIPAEYHKQFFLDMMDMVRGMEMMDEMIRCECKVGISRTNRLLAITNSDGSTVVEAARFSDLFIKLSRGEYVGRKE